MGRLMPRRTVCSRGLRFTMQTDNWITRYRWHTYNTKEPETLDWIDQWVEGADTFFDVGANIGVYSLYAALRHPRAHIVAFEPEYANLHLLRDNIAANGLGERIEVQAVALSDRSGLSWLHVQDFTPGAALHSESQERLATTCEHKPVLWREGIYALTMDQWCEETGVWPHAIKIDVDGTEPKVLRGAARALRQVRSVLLEVPQDSEARTACAALLGQAGLTPLNGTAWAAGPNAIWVTPSARYAPRHDAFAGAAAR